MSKNQRKKLEKLKKKEEEKKNKTIIQNYSNTQILDPQKYYENRLNVIEALTKDNNKYPYPHKFNITHSILLLFHDYENIEFENGDFNTNNKISTVGRIYSIRNQSKKLYFIDIESENKNIQIIHNSNFYEENSGFNDIINLIKRGDIIGVEGYIGRSKSGEFSIRASHLKLLSPCLRMLPQSRTGISDPEIRYRQRYLDLLVNSKTKEIFITRNKIIQKLRNFLTEKDFLEVETPILNLKAGGANARPFLTYHNELKQDMNLRIAPELYLKKLIIGGFDKVFEIGKNFRNEGIDTTHNPEFTSCELYIAYKDYLDMMEFTEEIICEIVKYVNNNKLVVQVDDNKEIDFSRPWKKIDMIKELENILNTKFPANLESEDAYTFLNRLCIDNDIECSEPRTNGRLLNKLSEFFIENNILNPTFIINQPQILCPLAKFNREDNQLTERFELFIDGKEFVNSYTELNDPFIQLELFKKQLENKQKGDLESNEIDEEYIKALEYGLPPTAGWGLGIDRLCMLLTNSKNIQEVILFPTLKNK